MKTKGSTKKPVTKHITIPEPCHENWSNMSPKEKGRHCDSCNKVVVDFTKNTKEEIVEHLEKAEGKTCGRFTSTQVHKPIVNTKNLGKIAASIIAIAGSQAGLHAQNQEMWMGEAIPESINIQENVAVNENSKFIKGKVVDADNKHIVNAKVAIYSGGQLIKSARTNENGEYRVELPSGTIAKDLVTIKVHATNYSMKSIDHLTIKKENSTLNITMSANNRIIKPTYEKGGVKLIETSPIHKQEQIEPLQTEPIEAPTNQVEEIGDIELIEEEIEQIHGDTILTIPSTPPSIDDIYMLGGASIEMASTDPKTTGLMGFSLVQEPDCTANNLESLAPPSAITCKEQTSFIYGNAITTRDPEITADDPINLGTSILIKEVDLIQLSQRIPADFDKLQEIIEAAEKPILPETDPNGNEDPETPKPASNITQGAIGSPISGGEDIEVTVFPNPSSDFVYLTVSESGEYKYLITDLIGNALFEGFFIGNKAEFSFRNQTSGVYIIRLFQGKDIHKSTKVVIQ